jgi:hemoglobin
MPSLSDHTSARDAMRRVVDHFYAAVRQDPQLGPVFNRSIPEEMWPVHLDRMLEFWSTVMLGTKSFRGNVQLVHQTIAGLTPELFERWLHLFGASAYALLEERDADEMMGVALRVAHGLRIGLFGKDPRNRPARAR